MGINYSIQLTFMECLLWACCWVKLVNISWTRLIFREMKYWLLKKKRKKYWLLLFVLSVIFPFNVYWMDTIARIIQIFNTFVCVCVCVCVCARGRTRACIPLHHSQNYSDLQHMCVCVCVCVHTCLHSTPPCVATPALAFCCFICRVHMPQPGFCHVQRYLLLYSTHPLSRHAHELSIPPFWQLILVLCLLLDFPSFIHWCIHLTNSHRTPLMFKLWSLEILGHAKMNQT